MYKALWKFKVKPEFKDRFERTYGPTGDWAQLFRRADGFVGTELLRDVHEENAYLTTDIWNSKKDFDLFKNEWLEEYKNLDSQCEPFTFEETAIGAFETIAMGAGSAEPLF